MIARNVENMFLFFHIINAVLFLYQTNLYDRSSVDLYQESIVSSVVNFFAISILYLLCSEIRKFSSLKRFNKKRFAPEILKAVEHTFLKRTNKTLNRKVGEQTDQIFAMTFYLPIMFLGLSVVHHKTLYPYNALDFGNLKIFDVFAYMIIIISLMTSLVLFFRNKNISKYQKDNVLEAFKSRKILRHYLKEYDETVREILKSEEHLNEINDLLEDKNIDKDSYIAIKELFTIVEKEEEKYQLRLKEYENNKELIFKTISR
jgi:hypothetical protein